MLTLADAIRTGKIKEFVAQEEDAASVPSNA